MSLVTCPNCLGEGEVFNGKHMRMCPTCKGDCVIQDPDNDDPPERFIPDDREPFDENKFYTDD